MPLSLSLLYRSYTYSFSTLAPGGYLEFQDCTAPFESDDGTLTEDTSTYHLGHLFLDASRAIGRPLDVASSYRDIMIRTGFVDVVERRLKWPMGTWPKDPYFKELGYWAHMNFDVGLEGLLMALLTRGLGWTKEEVLIYCAQARRGLRDPRVHAYLPV